VTDVYFSSSFATLSGHRPVEIRSLSVFPLRRQTDGYCTLPGHGASKQKTSIAVRIPRQLPPRGGCSTIKMSLCSFLLDSSGIQPERKKLKAAIIRA